MANNWPDGGETQLTRREKLIMGGVGVVLVGLVVGAALFAALAMMGRRPSVIEVAIVAVIGLTVGMLWVRPWETEPPRR